jgi:DNA processing protein
MEHFGSTEAICRAHPRELAQLRGVSVAQAERVRRAVDEADPDAERHAMDAHGARAILLGDDDYPTLLASIHDPPLMLAVRGSIDPVDQVALAVVGSRRCTAYGREQASRLAGLLGEQGLTIISGGARGIDAAAHTGAMRHGGRTIAVLGCGLARTYPPEHGDLFDRIAERGAVVSELPMHAPPKAEHFLPRNRIVAGMSLGVLVVEAARRSGALSTARQAADMGREVFALPGRADSASSDGCHMLIRHGSATLVTQPAHVMEALGHIASPLIVGALETSRSTAPAASPRTPPLAEAPVESAADALVDGVERRICAELQEPRTIDELIDATGLDASELMTALTMMELRGVVQRQGASFRRA